MCQFDFIKNKDSLTFIIIIIYFHSGIMCFLRIMLVFCNFLVYMCVPIQMRV